MTAVSGLKRPGARMRVASSGPVEATTERRSNVARRYKVFGPIPIRTENGIAMAHMLNISTTGAKLYMERPPKPGDSAAILIGEAWFEVTVRWLTESSFGVSFDAELTNDAVQKLLS
ncbi:PilZ domain-containing protein [Sphingomonas koreensis]|nr:PilZ domain-containing protein [Sphingomonas koreensis]